MARRWFEFWKPQTVSLAESIERLRMVDAKGMVRLQAVASALSPRPQTPSDHSSFGASGTPLSGAIVGSDDYNTELQGKRGWTIYDRMRRSDAQVRATLQMITLPILGAVWKAYPPEGGDAQDQAIADFVQSVLLDDDAMLHTWEYTLRHILLKLPFGFSPLEKVWMVGDAGELRLHRLSPCLPVSIEEFRVDQTGMLHELVQRAVKDGREQQLVVPGEYVAIFVNEKEGDNFNGISILRSAYKHWKYKDELYNIDAIAHERWGVGIPVARQTQAASMTKVSDKNAVVAVLENMRSHQQSWAIEPYGVEYRIMTPEGARGNQDIMRSIEHHDVMIARNILAPFMNVGQAEHGTRSSTEQLTDVFFNAVEGVATAICSDLKRQVVKPLSDLNFPMQGRQYSTIKVSNIRKVDPAVLAQTIERLMKAGGLSYSLDMENNLRALLGLSPLTAESVGVSRTSATGPQGGAGGTGDDETSEDAGEPTELHQLATARAGQPLRRPPTDFEFTVLSLNDIPRVLDRATDGLMAALVATREKQVKQTISLLGFLTEQDRAKPFAKFDPRTFELPYGSEIERAIKAHQDAIAMYGAEQVRIELRRQGAPVEIKHRIDVSRIKFALSEPIALDETVASAIVSRRSIRAMLDQSAQSTAVRLNESLLASILDEAQRFRRTGLVGTSLERALLQSLETAARTNVAAPARSEVNEAFALGRSGEAQTHRRLIKTVVQSAVLDTRTCSPCAAIDSQEMEYGSALQVERQPPYVHCQGRENCRCVQLFVYSGRV